jgi:hypothetical protein
MNVRRARLSLALIAGVTLMAGFSSASAQGTDEERRACTPDVMRLCREYIPSIDRIVACMEARHAELSPACQAVMQPPAPATVATAPAKPAARRTASRASGTKPVAAKHHPAKAVVAHGSPAAPTKTTVAKKTAARPLNLLPSQTKPASGKKVPPRDKQAQRTQ